MKKRSNRIRMFRALSLLALLLAGVYGGCGNPQPPQFSDIQIAYWAIAGTWAPLPDVRSGTAEGSPVLIEGIITDNTAVVDPSLSLMAQRRDVEEWNTVTCWKAPEYFYECFMACPEPDWWHSHYPDYVCHPSVPLKSLIRGDLYTVSLKTDQGDFRFEIQVQEAYDTDRGFLLPDREYRILKIINLVGNPNPFLWGVEYTTKLNPMAWDWLPLRSGDAILLKNRRYFQIRVKDKMTFRGVTYTVSGPPDVSYKSLVKWNEFFWLGLDPKTGGFVSEFQLFDPRQTRRQIENPEEAPLYTFVLAAHDVPDQVDETVRYASEAFDVAFSPGSSGIPAPEIFVEELGAPGETIWTSEASHTLTGTVRSTAGEVKSLQFKLSDGMGEPRIHRFDAGSFSLLGEFTTNIELVSDWSRFAWRSAPSEVPNTLEIAAWDMRGGGSKVTYEFILTPPTNTDNPPGLSLFDFYPPKDETGVAWMPASGPWDWKREGFRIWGKASDRMGQPEVSYQTFECDPPAFLAERKNLNKSRCSGSRATSVDTDASGRFPAAPWEFIEVKPRSAFPYTDVAVVFARETRKQDVPLFSAIAVTFYPEENGYPAYSVVSSDPASSGPSISQSSPLNGSIYPSQDPDNPDDTLWVNATIQQNFVEIDRIVALYNGRAPTWQQKGRISVTPITDGVGFTWGVPRREIDQGTRICFGAESIAGHETIHLIEFAKSAGGFLVGVSTLSNEDSCGLK